MIHQQTSLMADSGAELYISVKPGHEADHFSVMIYGEGGSTFLFFDKAQITKLADSLAKFQTPAVAPAEPETRVAFWDEYLPLPVAS